MNQKHMARPGLIKRSKAALARSAGRLAAILIGLGGMPVLAAAPTAPAALHIVVDRTGPTISRDMFGQFAEHLGTGIYGGVWVGPNSPIPNVRGIRSDVVAALRAIRVPNVRWPGGCFADDYHWHDGIGPRAKRPARLNAGWGGVIEPNQFGTAEYFDFLQQIGAEAYLSVNIGSGTAAEAADWLEYMTADKPTALAQERGTNGHPSPYRLAYLGLGNENWGCGGAMSTDHYVEEMKRFAHYTRNLDPAQTGATATKKIAVGWDGLNDGKSDYTEAVLKAWKAKVYSWDIDGISLHNYAIGGWPPRLPATGFGVDDYYTLMGEALLMEPKVAHEAALMDRYDPEKKLFLAVDEWGAWLAPTPGSHPGFLQQQNSMRDAVLASATLNIFMRHADRVRMANIAQMANVLQSMVLTDGPRMVLTPTYHVFHLYLPFQNATFMPVSLDAGRISHGSVSLPRMDAVAARDGQGRVWLAVTNLDPERAGSVALDDTVRSAAGQLLSAAKIDAVNSFAAPNQVTPRPFAAESQGGHLRLTLPPAAVAVVELKLR